MYFIFLWFPKVDTLSEYYKSFCKQLCQQEPVMELNPTEGYVWERRYFAVKDGEKIELQVGDKQPFYGKLNGKDVGLWKFLQEGYTFMNDAGVEISEDQAKIIAQIIKEHK